MEPTPNPLGLGARLAMALTLPWRVLLDGGLARRLDLAARAQPPEPTSATALPAARAAPAPVPEPTPDGPEADASALHLLALFQREGRLVDFLLEDVSAYSDREIGGAVRGVHEGCKKTLERYFTLKPIRSEDEGTEVVLEEGFDPAEIKLVGEVTGKPPFRGTLAHPGWLADEVRLPERSTSADVRVIAAAELEL